MEGLELERWDLDFSVAKSIGYHAYRRSFWDVLDRWSKVLTILTGAGVIISIVGSDHHDTAWSIALAALVAIFSAADIVLGFSTKARDHDGLYRAFSRLLQDIAEQDQPTRVDLAQWKRRRLEIEMDEPTALDWLERRCSAEEAVARGCPIDKAWKLKQWQILLSQWAMWPSFPRPETPPRS